MINHFVCNDLSLDLLSAVGLPYFMKRHVSKWNLHKSYRMHLICIPVYLYIAYTYAYVRTYGCSMVCSDVTTSF